MSVIYRARAEGGELCVFGKTIIHSVSWCPNTSLSVLAVAFDNKVVLLNTGLGEKDVVEQTDELLSEAPDDSSYLPPERVKAAVTWESAKANPISGLPKEALISLTFFKPVKQITWHGKGDYFATVIPEGLNRSVLIHQLSKWRSQLPFGKAKGLVQYVLFHPVR